MRILFLGNSNESLALQAGARLRHELLVDLLAPDFGAVEVVTKPAWPTADFPAVLQGWIERFRPDLVYLNVAEYWCLYESVPLQVERKLGRVGKPLARAGIRAAETPRLAHNRVFRKFREVAQASIGGGTYFTPGEVVDRVLACVRICLRGEGLLVVIDGQRGRRPYATTATGRRRVEARRQFVHQRLKEECERMHAIYAGDDIPQWQTHPEGMHGHADGLHQGAAGQLWMAQEAAQLIRAAVAAEARI